MRTYKVSGMTCGGCERSVSKAIKAQFGEEVAVEADSSAGEVRVSEFADPQAVIFAIDGAGYVVKEVVGGERGDSNAG